MGCGAAIRQGQPLASAALSDLSRLPLSLLSAVGFGFAALAGAPPALWAQPAAATAPAVTPVTGLVTIESDLQRADNLTGVVTASGNVRIVYADRRVVATARQAQYFSREGRVVLSGDVDVIQENGPSIQADRLTYLVEQERLVAEPLQGQQVMSRIPITTSVDPTPGVDPIPTQPAVTTP
jgi:lipopolysaccharide export system protein LptA